MPCNEADPGHTTRIRAGGTVRRRVKGLDSGKRRPWLTKTPRGERRPAAFVTVKAGVAVAARTSIARQG